MINYDNVDGAFDKRQIKVRHRESSRRTQNYRIDQSEMNVQNEKSSNAKTTTTTARCEKKTKTTDKKKKRGKAKTFHKTHINNRFWALLIFPLRKMMITVLGVYGRTCVRRAIGSDEMLIVIVCVYVPAPNILLMAVSACVHVCVRSVRVYLLGFYVLIHDRKIVLYLYLEHIHMRRTHRGASSVQQWHCACEVVGKEVKNKSFVVFDCQKVLFRQGSESERKRQTNGTGRKEGMKREKIKLNHIHSQARTHSGMHDFASLQEFMFYCG